MASRGRATVEPCLKRERPGCPVRGAMGGFRVYAALPVAAVGFALVGARDARDADHVAAAHFAGDAGLMVPAAAFELDLVEVHEEAVGADLADALLLVEVAVAVAPVVGFLADGLAAGLEGIAGQLAHFTAGLAILVEAAAIVAAAIGVVAGRADGERQRGVIADAGFDLGDRAEGRGRGREGDER